MKDQIQGKKRQKQKTIKSSFTIHADKWDWFQLAVNCTLICFNRNYTVKKFH